MTAGRALPYLLRFIGLFLAIQINGPLAFAQLPAVAGPVQLFAKGPHSEVSLRLPEIFHETQTDAIAVEFKIEKDWHIYWENPGDSGEEPRFDFRGSLGLSFGRPIFPLPKRIAAGPFTNFGFDSQLSPAKAHGKPVSIRIPIKVVPGGDSGLAIVVLDLTYLVCKEECIPAAVKLRGIGKVRTVENSAAVVVPYETRDFPPMQGLGSRGEPVSGKWDLAGPDQILFRLPGFDPKGGLETIEFFPLASFNSLHGSSGKFSLIPGSGTQGMQAIIDLDPNLPAPNRGAVLEGLLVDRSGARSAWVRLEALTELDFLGLLRAIGFAFLGGLILNLMPCVFPVVSLKVLSFVHEAHGDRRETKIHAALYAFGVLLSLWLLLAILLLMRTAGTAVGWGFQLQNPVFLMTLYAVFIILGFNLLGVFEIHYSGPRAFQKLLSTRGRMGSFFTGLLTTLVATPCSAPFMGVAIGTALASGILEAVVVFTALGIGLASPYVFLGMFPKFVDSLPRPGPWMDHFKQFLAFPLFLTAVWLLWVLGQASDVATLIMIASWTVMAGLFVWSHNAKLKYISIGALIFLILGFAIISKVLLTPMGSSPNESLATDEAVSKPNQWEDYNESAVQAALARGDSVFVDYTASWCVTCQINKKLVLETERASSLFRDKKVRLFRADWTKRDAEIAKSLSRLGRQSVPVYAFYRSGSTEPEVLAEILTVEILETALSR